MFPASFASVRLKDFAGNLLLMNEVASNSACLSVADSTHTGQHVACFGSYMFPAACCLAFEGL